jgi:hypothetical protein
MLTAESASTREKGFCGRRGLRLPLDPCDPFAVVDALEAIARAHDSTVARIALAWTVRATRIGAAIYGLMSGMSVTRT